MCLQAPVCSSGTLVVPEHHSCGAAWPQVGIRGRKSAVWEVPACLFCRAGATSLARRMLTWRQRGDFSTALSPSGETACSVTVEPGEIRRVGCPGEMSSGKRHGVRVRAAAARCHCGPAGSRGRALPGPGAGPGRAGSGASPRPPPGRDGEPEAASRPSRCAEPGSVFKQAPVHCP